MTLVLEAGAVAAAVTAAVGHGHNESEQWRKERECAGELYKRFFSEDLYEVSSDRRTEIADTISASVHPRAVQAVRVIERYQKTTKRKLFGFLETENFKEGDVRTHILEEIKCWLAGVSEESLSAQDVYLRLEYCRQVILRPSMFEPKMRESRDQRSFLQTLGEVCQQLEELLRMAQLSDQSEAHVLKRIFALGRDIVDATAPSLFLTLPSDEAVPRRSGQSYAGTPEALGLSHVLDAMGNSGADADDVLDSSTDVGDLLRRGFEGRHFRDLSASDQELLTDPSVIAAAGRSAADETPASGELREAQERLLNAWGADEVDPSRSGLLPAFCGAPQRGARLAFVQLCGHLDRAAFFLAILRQYTRLTNVAGEMAANHLRSPLSHLLQELEKALAEVRLSQLEVSRAAKRRLHELALAGIPNSDAERRWAQGLRHVGDGQLDRLHRTIGSDLTAARAAASTDRSAELNASAKKGLQDIASTFQSADFQARLKVTDGLRRQVQLAVTGGDPPPPTLTRALEVD